MFIGRTVQQRTLRCRHGPVHVFHHYVESWTRVAGQEDDYSTSPRWRDFDPAWLDDAIAGLACIVLTI